MRKIRIHLSVAVLLMLTASLLLGVNLLHATVREEYAHSESAIRIRTLGWPYAMYEESVRIESADTSPSKGSHRFCKTGDRLRIDVEAALPDQTTFKWSCIDPADLKIPEKFATNSTLVFVPKYAGNYVFECVCNREGHNFVIRTDVTAYPVLPNKDGWNTKNALLNAAVSVFGLLLLAVVMEWFIRRRTLP